MALPRKAVNFAPSRHRPRQVSRSRRSKRSAAVYPADSQWARGQVSSECHRLLQSSCATAAWDAHIRSCVMEVFSAAGANFVNDPNTRAPTRYLADVACKKELDSLEACRAMNAAGTNKSACANQVPPCDRTLSGLPDSCISYCHAFWQGSSLRSMTLSGCMNGAGSFLRGCLRDKRLSPYLFTLGLSVAASRKMPSWNAAALFSAQPCK